MKLLIAAFFISSLAVAAPTGKNRILPVTKDQEQVKKDKAAQDKLKEIGIAEEDCDEKAKKPVEIKPESISLSGNTGCTLDEAH